MATLGMVIWIDGTGPGFESITLENSHTVGNDEFVNGVHIVSRCGGRLLWSWLMVMEGGGFRR
jgi:hypothetical protein